MKKVVIIGPGPKFKGGIALFTTSLARTLSSFENVDVHIISWTNQYPSIIPRDFIDRNSKIELLENSNVSISYITNYNNPFSWLDTIRAIKKINPDILIVQWAVSIQGLPLGFIARRVRKQINCEIIYDLHVVEQKEQTALDKSFLTYALSNADTFIVHSKRTIDELKRVFPERSFCVSEDGSRNKSENQNIITLYHPIYDIYKSGTKIDLNEAKKELGLKSFVFLFFGFIRKYKGLHYILPAFAELIKERKNVSLLIVGESFWQTLDNRKLSTKLKSRLFAFAKTILGNNKSTESNYNPLKMIEELGISDNCVVVNKYIPNEEVYKYYELCDCNFLYYTIATPSGVESIAYNFGKPSIAVKAGHFLDSIIEGSTGYFAEPENIESLVEAMKKAMDYPIQKESVYKNVEKFSWHNYSKAILKV